MNSSPKWRAEKSRTYTGQALKREREADSLCSANWIGCSIEGLVSRSGEVKRFASTKIAFWSFRKFTVVIWWQCVRYYTYWIWYRYYIVWNSRRTLDYWRKFCTICWKSGRFTRNFFRVPKRSLHFRLLNSNACSKEKKNVLFGKLD